MDDVGLAIRKARKAKKLTLEAVAAMVGTDTGNLSRLERGKQGASQELLSKVLTALGLSLSGAIQAGAMRSNLESTGVPSSSVPVLAWADVSRWMEDMSSFSAVDAENWVPCPIEHGPRTFIVKVTGESMSSPHSARSFRPGDFIFVDPDRSSKPGSFVVAQLHKESEPVLRELVFESRQRYLKALNPNWPEQIFKMTEEDKILGVVIFKGEIL